MDNECVEMDLSTRQREPQLADNCKMRVAKSVFSIRSLVDLGDGSEKADAEENVTPEHRSGEWTTFLLVRSKIPRE